MSANVNGQGGFFTGPDFCTSSKAEYNQLMQQCKRGCKVAIADVRKAFKATGHARSRTTYKTVGLITEGEADELADEIAKCDAQETPLYPGAKGGTQLVYLGHPHGNVSFERAGHLVKHRAVQKAIKGARKAMQSMHPAGKARKWKPIKPLQVFANIYRPRKKHEVPWHRDVDTRLGSVILVPRGDDGDVVQVQGKREQVFNEAPKPGHAIIMTKNVLHAVPRRKSRKTTRIALVIWF